MKDYESFAPIEIVKADGIYLHTRNGQRLIDSSSSWWCQALGHNHPTIRAAIKDQLDQFHHVILANTNNEVVSACSDYLSTLKPGLDKVFYASDGSCAVEIALKMSLQSRHIRGQPQRHQLAALQCGYHGETFMAMSVSDCDLYKAPFAPWCQAATYLDQLPVVSGSDDPLWQDASTHWAHTLQQLEPLSNTLTAVIVEPIVQAAGGMRIISQDWLKRLCRWCQAHDIHFIADEIMTGFGRTGRMLATDHADITPDFMCLGKGLTAGSLPLSATLTSDAMYQLFYDDYETGKAFMHSHTHSGNALACRAAMATKDVMASIDICDRARQLGNHMREAMTDIANTTQRLHNIRHIGALVAADIINPEGIPRLGYQVYQEAVKLGALLRPLGNTIYWCPPITMTAKELGALQGITHQAIDRVGH